MPSFTLSKNNNGLLPNQPAVIMVDDMGNVVPRVCSCILHQVVRNRPCPGRGCVYTPQPDEWTWKSFREWRVLPTKESPTPARWSVFRLGLYDVEYGQNLIVQGQGQALSSGNVNYEGFEVEQALFDRDASWGGRQSENGEMYLGWSFAEPKMIKQVQLLQAAPALITSRAGRCDASSWLRGWVESACGSLWVACGFFYTESGWRGW